MGWKTISRTEVMAVMAATYRSPVPEGAPQLWSWALPMAWTRLLVTEKVKPVRPRPHTRRKMGPSSPRLPRSRRRMARRPVRKASTQAAEQTWAITVASAAPRTPMPRTKIKRGSRIRLITAPSSVVIMPVLPKPWALMKGFIPRPIITGMVPAR